jgi:hypothetical protein
MLRESLSRVSTTEKSGGRQVASTKQRTAAKKNIKKAASSAKRKRTIAHLPKSVRTALGKKASSVAEKKKKSRG